MLTADAGERAIMRVPPKLAIAVSWLPLTDGSTGVSEALHLIAKKQNSHVMTHMPAVKDTTCDWAGTG
jgi:hypothetical protein